jgi:hypothetical protein
MFTFFIFVFASLSLLNQLQRRISSKQYSNNPSSSSGALIYTALTMERLFSPCTRFDEILESSQVGLVGIRGPSEPMQELNLNVSTEDLLSTERAFTYVDLYALLRHEATIAWLTPYTAAVRADHIVVQHWSQLDESCRFSFSVDGKDIIALALSSEHLLEICEVVLRLLAVSVVHSIRLHNWSSPDLVINALTLANLMEHCQSLKSLALIELEMNEDHCRVLGAFSRPGLEIVLHRCTITSAGASALAEGLGRNQGPTKLHLCQIDNSVLAEGLRGNSRLESLKLRLSNSPEDIAIMGALRENKGLVALHLMYYEFRLNDESWGVICDSLKAHPTLEVLNLRVFTDFATAPAVIKSQIQTILDMMKLNLSIYTIHLPDRYSEHELFRESVVPYLETNRLRPRLLAIQKTRPIAYRFKVLGIALLSARTDANSFWMLLSGNAEVAIPSTARLPRLR